MEPIVEVSANEKAIRHDERKRLIAQGCIHTRKAGENADYDRPDVSAWQNDQGEYFDPTICEIVSEYAAWRDQQAPSPDLKADNAALVERIRKLELALKPFAFVASLETKAEPYDSTSVSVKICRDAAAALQATDPRP